jgi:hypothetical protein
LRSLNIVFRFPQTGLSTNVFGISAKDYSGDYRASCLWRNLSVLSS